MTRQTKYKIGSGLVPFSPCADRFLGTGYRDPLPLEKQIAAMAAVEGMRGVALDYPAQFTDDQVPQVRELYRSHGFELPTLEIGLYAHRDFRLGSLASTDPGVRRKAMEVSRRALDLAAEMGAADVLLWPGQDGYDYPFQVDYSDTWRLLFDGIAEVAAHRPDVRIAIEYKPKEPRANCYIRNAGILLWMLRRIAMPNVGATIDFGHALVAGENAAEAAALLADEGKLFQVHLNDNYRDWDHDLIVGSVNWLETLEFLYYVVRSGYDGWYLMDVFPYREDGTAAIRQCVTNTERYLDWAHNIPAAALKSALSQSDPIRAHGVLRDYLFRGGQPQ